MVKKNHVLPHQGETRRAGGDTAVSRRRARGPVGPIGGERGSIHLGPGPLFIRPGRDAPGEGVSHRSGALTLTSGNRGAQGPRRSKNREEMLHRWGPRGSMALQAVTESGPRTAGIDRRGGRTRSLAADQLAREPVSGGRCRVDTGITPGSLAWSRPEPTADLPLGFESREASAIPAQLPMKDDVLPLAPGQRRTVAERPLRPGVACQGRNGNERITCNSNTKG
jgi:hypothetical protein